MSRWTDNEIEILSRRRREGASSDVIARELKRSRHAVAVFCSAHPELVPPLPTATRLALCIEAAAKRKDSIPRTANETIIMMRRQRRSAAEIANALNTSVTSVKRRVQQLIADGALEADGGAGPPPYSAAEDEIIVYLYAREPASQIVRRLHGRSEASIQQRIAHLQRDGRLELKRPHS